MKRASDRIGREIDDPSPTARADTSSERTLVFAGAGVMFAGALVGWILMPSRNDLLDVVNSWNAAHPAAQFELDRVPRHAHD